MDFYITGFCLSLFTSRGFLHISFTHTHTHTHTHAPPPHTHTHAHAHMHSPPHHTHGSKHDQVDKQGDNTMSNALCYSFLVRKWDSIFIGSKYWQMKLIYEGMASYVNFSTTTTTTTTAKELKKFNKLLLYRLHL